MSFFFGKKQKVKPEYTALQGQTSTSTLAIPLVWGAARIAPNIIWAGDFTAHKQKQKTGKGFSPSITSYTYTASFEMGLCQGPISSVGRGWKDQAKFNSYTDMGLTLFTGTYPQAPWGYMGTSHAGQALGYNGTAHLDVANYDLGNANTLGNHSFEIFGLRYNTQVDGTGDADPALVIDDYLTDPHWGALFPGDFINDAALFSGPDYATTGDGSLQTYCRVMGVGMSPALSDQEQAATTLDRWTSFLNTAIVWTGYTLKFIPYDAASASAHGAVYNPADLIAVRYYLTNDHYVADGNQDPIILSRLDPADAVNSLSMEVVDRTNEYNAVPIQWKDQGLIDRYGLREGNSITAHELTSPLMATRLVALMGQRGAYIRNEYKCTVPSMFIRLEPMDVVTCRDRNLGIFTCRVKEIEEQDNGDLNLLLEEFPEGTSSAPNSPSQTVSNTPTNTAVVASNINPPIIFEPRSDLTGGVAQVWAAISGGDGVTYDPNWGGAFVWLSTDGGVQYQQIGQQDTAARMGVLTAALAANGGVNPDITHTLRVSLTMSKGDLSGVTSAEAADAVTLSYCDGELLSYMDATMTGTNNYDLGGELYRGLYGTADANHLSGTAFARLDENIFKFDLPKTYIGNSIYLKFQSYNIYGQGVEDLASVTPYTYTPAGTGFGGGTAGVPTTPTGLAAVAGLQQTAVSWNANPSTDGVVSYQVWRATGTGQLFGSAAKIATVAGQYFLDTSLTAGQGYTYFLVATNTVGNSSPTAGVNATTSSSSITTYRLYGSIDSRRPDAGEELFDIEMKGDETFADDFAGSLASADVASTGTATFDIQKNGVSVGSLVFTSSATGVFTTSGGALSFASGDRFRLSAPATQDATLSGPRYTFIGSR